MATVRVLRTAFNGGEVSPEFFGQIQDATFQRGAATLRNFIPLPHGPAVSRPGTMFVREVKDSSSAVRLIPFTYSSTQTMVLELGNEYVRFHTAGATLLYPVAAAWNTSTAYVVGDLVTNTGTTYYCIEAHTSGTFATDLAAGKWYAEPASGEYEIPSPWAEADLFELHYVQSADVLTVVHPGYAPRELRRQGATNWQITTISFAPLLSAPGSVTATATTGSGLTTYRYKVTAVAESALEESYASASASCTNDLLTSGNANTVGWAAVTGAIRYRVYKQDNGLYGLIGETDGTSFVDQNIAADVSQTPPEARTPFASDYPGAVSYFEQRRAFAGTTALPQNIWMTRTGTESNLSISIPSRDDDAIAIRVAAREANTIRHLVPLGDLILLTGSAEWRMTSVNSDAITPTSVSVKPQSYIGASQVQPVIVNNALLYAAARGGHIRELAYNWQANGYVTGDLSLRATHLFDGLTVDDVAFQKAPHPSLWAISSNGRLLSLTYVPEQQVGAWARHDTDGLFESVAVVAEGEEDRVYVVARRTIDGNTVRYVERMASRLWTDVEDCVRVDCAATYSGAAATTISGLSHLEGETVSVLADGGVVPPRVVASGQITLPVAASTVHVGLPITADLETLPMAAQVDNAFGQGRQKNVSWVRLRVSNSSGVWVGPTSSTLTQYRQRTTEPYGSPPSLKSEVIEVVPTPSWGEAGAVFIRQTDPLPLTIASMSVGVSLGG